MTKKLFICFWRQPSVRKTMPLKREKHELYEFECKYKVSIYIYIVWKYNFKQVESSKSAFI
jgi:hypothetical protein